MGKKYPIVNDQDEIIGYMDKEEAYEKKQMLRAIQIFVYNSEGKLYVQKRGKNKKRFPNYFCSSVAGHVEPKESYEQAALRELKEELNIKNNNLIFIEKIKAPVGEGNYSMTAFFTLISDEPITPSKKETCSGRFYTIEEIKKMISISKNFTPGFLFFF